MLNNQAFSDRRPEPLPAARNSQAASLGHRHQSDLGPFFILCPSAIVKFFGSFTAADFTHCCSGPKPCNVLCFTPPTWISNSILPVLGRGGGSLPVHILFCTNILSISGFSPLSLLLLSQLLPQVGRGGAQQTSFVVQMCSLPVAGLPCHVAALDLSLGIVDSGGARQDRAGPISFPSRVTNISRVSNRELFVYHSPLSLPPDLASSAQHLPGAGVHFGISHMAHGGRGRRELPLSTASPGAAFPAEEPPWCCSPASGSLPERSVLSLGSA